MEIVTVEREARVHEIHISGTVVKQWWMIPTDGERKGERILASRQQSKPYKVYEDKKGKFIRLYCDGTYKHYI